MTEKIETETHHNQGLTAGAAQRMAPAAGKKPGRKVVALRLDDREDAALGFLGGVSGLKALLCPEGLCIKCRKSPSIPGTRWHSLCTACDAQC